MTPNGPGHPYDAGNIPEPTRGPTAPSGASSADLLAAVERERDRAVGSSRMWQQNAEETVDELAAALARIAAVEAQLAGVRALAARLRDYHGGFDQIEQERKHIAEVIDDALALQADYLGPWLAASPTPTGPEPAKRPCCARPGWCACDPLTPGDEHCQWFVAATPEPTEETP